MVRFARAKGSKASNERIPEESTPWEVMKQQLEQKKEEVENAKKFREMEAIRKANYNSFLEERENNIETEWVEFEDVSNNQNKSISVKSKKGKKQKVAEETVESKPELTNIISKSKQKSINSKKLEKKAEGGIDNEAELENLIFKIEEVLEKEDSAGKKKKNKSKKKVEEVTEENISDDDAPEEVSAKIAPIKNKIKLKLPTKKQLKIPSVNMSGNNEINEIDTDEIVVNDKNNTRKEKKNNKRKINEDIDDKNVKKQKKSEVNSNLEKNKNMKAKKYDSEKVNNFENPKKKKQNKKNNDSVNSKVHTETKTPENLSEDQLKRFNKKKEKRMRQLERKKKFKAEQREKALLEEQNQNMKKQQLPKQRDNQEHHKRKPNSEIRRMNINGIEVDIDYYDGFPIKKEDAERLRKLRKEMISKGIPRSEVQRALKLERRKAEKALAREKKKVCFNCRRSGHNLSECPDINESFNQEMTGTGICFKCGSTEHTHFECRVVKNDNFKFATCFICREQGHISRQCPDNQKGLYPKGGACRVCGDVTHLKKDCPTFQTEQESQIIKLDTLELNNVESLPEDQHNTKILHKNKKAKVVKF